jgi:hypothetical protein
MSLELVPGDGIDVHMGIAIRLPPVGYCPIELVRSKKDLLAISALGDHEILFNILEPIFCIHGVFGLWEGGGVSSQEVGVLAAGWAAYCWGPAALLALAGSGWWVVVPG